jgi:ubiquinone/menaquinone biosynthesis C-methylase UbiE
MHPGSDPPTVPGGRPPWEIGRPQPAIVALAQAGALNGRVLDVGCGTGEHTLLAAAMGLDATGIDISVDALDTAQHEAVGRGLPARFIHLDVLKLAELGETFDTALDSLVFHAITGPDRPVYLDGLRAVLRPGGRLFVLCYSDQNAAEPEVPHRTTLADIGASFAQGWAVDAVRAVRSLSNLHPNGVPAWLITCTRT